MVNKARWLLGVDGDAPKKSGGTYWFGDNTAEALGPAAFDRSSLARLFGACGRIAIVASAPEADVYQAVAMAAAMLRQHVAVVETRARYEADLLAIVKKAAPAVPLLLCTDAAAGHA